MGPELDPTAVFSMRRPIARPAPLQICRDSSDERTAAAFTIIYFASKTSGIPIHSFIPAQLFALAGT